MLTGSQIENIGIGYDADGGGYAFERANSAFGVDVLTDSEGSILGEYIGSYGADDVRFAPYDANHTWPERVKDPEWDLVYVLESTGVLYGTDHTCIMCSDDAGDPVGCVRCGDTGYVDSPGGSWAVYGTVDAPCVEEITTALVAAVSWCATGCEFQLAPVAEKRVAALAAALVAKFELEIAGLDPEDLSLAIAGELLGEGIGLWEPDLLPELSGDNRKAVVSWCATNTLEGVELELHQD